MSTTTSAPASVATRPAWMRFAFPVAWVVLTAIAALLPTLGLSLFWTRQIFVILLMALLVSGLNLTFGWAGELNLGFPAMYAAGAFASGWFYIHVINDTLVGILVGAAVAVVVGLIAGIPGMRLGGWALAISSFFLVLLIPSILQLIPKEILGGYDGLIGIPRPMIFGVKIGSTGLFVVAVIVTSIWLLLYRNLVKSRTGSALLILQHGDALAPSLGLNRYGLKLRAYAIGSIPAGIAGALFAHLDSFVGAETFTFTIGISALAAGVVAGLRSAWAILAGAAIIIFMTFYSSDFAEYGEVAFGVFLVLGGLVLGGGLSALVARLLRRVRTRGRTATVESTAAVQGPLAIESFPGKTLRVDAITKRFGGVVALDEVSFEAKPGQITALIGPNGSGKTTMLNMINGFYRATSGSITLGDTEISQLPDRRVARLGVSRTFQTPAIPGNMTTREVVAASRIASNPVDPLSTMLRLPRYRRIAKEDARIANSLLSSLGLGSRADDLASSLALGTRRMTELARALADDPSLILLDEIASGLDHNEVAELARVLRLARDSGATIILVEHNFTLVRTLADHVVVLADGKLLVDGTPAVIEQHPEFLTRFLGSGAGISGTTVAAASAAAQEGN